MIKLLYLQQQVSPVLGHLGDVVHADVRKVTQVVAARVVISSSCAMTVQSCVLSVKRSAVWIARL